jgi:hypothetical protein
VRGFLLLIRFAIVAVVLIGFGIYELVIIPTTSSVTFVDQLIAARDVKGAYEAERRLLDRDRARFQNDPELISRIPKLIALMGVRNDKGLDHVLAGIGRPAVAPLVAAFDAPVPRVAMGGLVFVDDDTVRSQRLISLFETCKLMHEEAPEVAPRLVTYFDDKNAMVADKCVEAVAAFGRDAVPTLIAVLNDPRANRRMRRYAVITLNRIGPDAAQALPALRTTLTKAGDKKEKELIEAAIRNAQRRP